MSGAKRRAPLISDYLCATAMAHARRAICLGSGVGRSARTIPAFLALRLGPQTMKKEMQKDPDRIGDSDCLAVHVGGGRRAYSCTGVLCRVRCVAPRNRIIREGRHMCQLEKNTCQHHLLMLIKILHDLADIGTCVRCATACNHVYFCVTSHG